MEFEEISEIPELLECVTEKLMSAASQTNADVAFSILDDGFRRYQELRQEQTIPDETVDDNPMLKEFISRREYSLGIAQKLANKIDG